MDLTKVISMGFDLYVKDKFKGKEDIKNFLLSHERRSIFENNMKKELYHSFHVVKNAETFKSIVKDCSAMFCMAAIKQKEKELRGNKPS
jgi:hypothetical protein